MNKIFQGLSYEVYSTSVPKFKTSESSLRIPDKMNQKESVPFYPSAVLLCCDNINYYIENY